MSETVIIQEDSLSLLYNARSGEGDAEYDPAVSDTIETAIDYLKPDQIAALCAKSNIVNNIIEVYPNDATFGYPSINSTYGSYGITSEDLVTYLNDRLQDSDNESLEEAFRSASKLSRKWGVAYIIMGIDDGRMPDQPIDETSIKTIEYLVVANKFQLVPDNYWSPKIYDFNFDLSSSAEIFTTLKTRGTVRIHKSRVLTFYGVAKPELRDKVREPLSCLQGSLSALLTRQAGLSAARRLLARKGLLWAKVQIQAASLPQERRSALESRLRFVNSNAGVHKMVGLGENEELGTVQIELAHVAEQLTQNDSNLIAESAIARFRLFGQSAGSGFSQASSDIGQKADHAERCTNWSIEHWKKPLKRIYRLVTLAKDSPTKGRTIKGLDVTLLTNIKLTPVEWAELRKLNSDWAKALLEAGVVTVLEVREAFFNSADLFRQLVPNILLDAEFTKSLKPQSDADETLTKALSVVKDSQESLTIEDVEKVLVDLS